MQKSLINGCLRSWMATKRMDVMKCPFFVFYATRQPLSQSNYDWRWKMFFYHNRRSSSRLLDDGVPRLFSKPNMNPKKVIQTVRWFVTGFIYCNIWMKGNCKTLKKSMKCVRNFDNNTKSGKVNRKCSHSPSRNTRRHVAKLTKKLNEKGSKLWHHQTFPLPSHFFKHLDNVCLKMLKNLCDFQGTH